jgi:excisionase family DNA binding protein
MADDTTVRFLTTAEAAKLLGVQLRWVQTLIQKKRLKASKPGGRDYLIDVKDLACLQIRKPGRPRGSGLKRNVTAPRQQQAEYTDNEESPVSDQKRCA